MIFPDKPSFNHYPGTPARQPLWTKIVINLAFFFPIVGAAASSFMLKTYLPSKEWFQQSDLIIMGFTAVVWLLCAASLIAINRFNRQQNEETMGPIKLYLLMLFMTLLIYLYVGELVRRGVPAVVAMIDGTSVEHDYVVERTSKNGHRGCRSNVEVEGMFLNDTVCKMPFHFVEQLSPGMPVTFIGKGTWMGLFVEDFRKL